jgi:hypothetical protein
MPSSCRGQARQEIAFAFLLDGGAELNIAARTELAILEDRHRPSASRRGVDDCDDLVERIGFVETNRSERRRPRDRINGGQNGPT